MIKAQEFSQPFFFAPMFEWFEQELTSFVGQCRCENAFQEGSDTISSP